MTISVQSKTDPNTFYELDLENRTCSCPAFTKAPNTPCKHLREHVPELKAKLYPTHPTYSKAISAVIKAVRLRYVDDAVYWALYLRTFPKDAFKFGRRMGIISAEDNLNIYCMERMAEYMNSHLWKPETHRMGTLRIVAELIRLCKTPNWWALPDGRDYVRDWARGEDYFNYNQARFKAMPFESLVDETQKWVAEGDSAKAIGTMNSVWVLHKAKAPALVQALHRIAKKSGSAEAIQTAELYAKSLKMIGVDSNLPGHILYRAVHGTLGEQGKVVVTRGEAEEIWTKAANAWKNPKPISPFYCDGIHTSGGDRRFSGCSDDMAAAASAFEHYGRLSPDDQWHPEFRNWNEVTPL